MNLRFFSRVVTYKTMLLLFLLTGLVFSATNASSDVDLSLKWQIDTDSLNITHAQFSHDGKYVYVSSGNNIYKVSTEFGAVVSKFENTFDPPITAIVSLDMSANGDSLATHDKLGNIHFWDTEKEKMTGHFKIPASELNPFYRGVTFSLDFKQVFAILRCKENGFKMTSEIVKYDITENFKLDSLNLDTLMLPWLSAIQMSHDGKSFAFDLQQNIKHDSYWFYYNDILVYDSKTFEQLHYIDIEQTSDYHLPNYIKFSEDDRYIGRVMKESYEATETIICDVNSESLIFGNETVPNNFDNFEFFKDSDHYIVNNRYKPSFEILSIQDVSFSKSYDYSLDLIEVSNNDKYVFISDSNMIHIFDVKETGIQDLTTNASYIRVSASNGSIIVRSDELYGRNAQVIICDLLGRPIHSISSYNQKEIVINHNLLSGFYLCNVVVGADVYSYRILINR
ncbi:MAG: hypothetical protein PF588_00150 [Candidatus Kapabacteria bacterium]|jgi:hypothetical protein|nr:hypothetical protein [Candidatus Kapabacteria bacterium]